MKKLKLDVDMLEVQTFSTGTAGTEGTVVAHSGWTNCGGVTCLLSLCPDCGSVGTA